jgi:thiol-disulfide isomerase/thioredoxin
MKKIVLAAAAAMVVAACGTNSITKVSGTLPAGSQGNEVQIVAGQLDTTLAVQDGKFCIDIPSDLLTLAYAVADGRQVQFVADGSKINVNFEDGIAQSSAKKGVHSRLVAYQDWNDKFMTDFRAKITAEGLSDEDKEDIYEEAEEKYNKYLEETIKANPDNILGLIAISNIELEDDEKMLELIGGMSEAIRQDPRVSAMRKAIEASAKTAEGMMFTDFEVNGVKFSDFIGQGKYVLVDFWASWCGPCRREMPNLRNVYEKFHGDKFDMLSVAVWDKKEDTIQAAAEENIVWNQIIDAQRIPTEIYGIQGIPHIILFGPDGTILKRNLRGDAIVEAVADALDD